MQSRIKSLNQIQARGAIRASVSHTNKLDANMSLEYEQTTCEPQNKNER